MLQMFKYLITVLPLVPINEDVVKYAPLEDLAQCIYRLILKISLEFASDEIKPMASFGALDWLAEQW